MVKDLPKELSDALAEPRRYPAPWFIRCPSFDAQHAYYITAKSDDVFRMIYGSDSKERLQGLIDTCGMGQPTE